MQDESYIQIALELAKKGKGRVSPKPLAGALVVKNNKIISAAYRSCPDEVSTELTAINICKDNAEGSTLYTNIEPCALIKDKSGCIDSIIQSKIKKIVLGSVLSDPQLESSPIKKFKKAGIEVSEGILKKECKEINKFYYKYDKTSLPFVSLKMAVTIDGKIADDSGNSKWITSVESRSLVHELRNEFDAVLVGCNTARVDKPQLTVRLVEGRNPKRIVLDSCLDIKCYSNLIKNNSDKNLIVVTYLGNKKKQIELKKLNDNNVEVIFCKKDKSGKVDLTDMLKKLGERNIVSLLVEGGGELFSSFIKKKLEDEILLFMGPKILGNGIPLCKNLGIKGLSKAFSYGIKDIEKVGEDAFIRFVRR